MKPVFKIYNTKIEKFSTGGLHPNFTSRGKAWGTLSDLMRHLAALEDTMVKYYEDCVIITYTPESATKIKTFYAKQKLEK